MRIKPFNALRPPVELVSKIASLPYDVVDTHEARAQAKDNPYSFFHVSRAEIDLPDGTDLYDDSVYAKAAANFRALLDRKSLVRDSDNALYLYRLIRGEHSQRGIVTVCHVDDYDAGLIKKHEKTRKAPEDDRTRHIATTGAQTGPVFLAYRDRPRIDAMVGAVEKQAPLYDFTAPDGIRHSIWKIVPADELVKAFEEVPAFYIADGHHRAAAAARVARERRAANAAHTGCEEYNWFQTVLFPAGQLRILPYNRCVKDLNGRSRDEFMAAVRERFAVSEKADPQPKAPAHVSLFLGGRWYGLSWTPDPKAGPVERLDVSVLQDRLLNPVLGIDDPRKNPRIEFVGGIRGTGELEQRVTSGRSAVAFSMYPTTVDQLMAIADAGEIMPPKSTWFEPKLRDGLLIHALD